jgi:hypothetical protein
VPRKIAEVYHRAIFLIEPPPAPVPGLPQKKAPALARGPGLVQAETKHYLKLYPSIMPTVRGLLMNCTLPSVKAGNG